MNDIDQSTFLTNLNGETPKGFEQLTNDALEIAEAEGKKEASIPAEYKPVTFCTQGKLMAPKVLHFRNYTLEETAQLALVNETNQYAIYSKLLNNMVYEDFDCRDLAPEEVIQVLLTIYATWWDRYLEVQKYYVNTELEDEELTAKDNISIARVQIKDLEFVDLDDKNFKAPFNIKINDSDTYGVRFPTIRDKIVTQKYLEKKFEKEDREFARYSKQLENGTASLEQMNAFTNYISEKTKESLIAERAQLLVSKNGEELSLQDKVKVARTLDLRFWETISSAQLKYKYGLDTKDVPFICTVTGRPIRRELRPFEYDDFLPSLRNEIDSGYQISFD